MVECEKCGSQEGELFIENVSINYNPGQFKTKICPKCTTYKLIVNVSWWIGVILLVIGFIIGNKFGWGTDFDPYNLQFPIFLIIIYAIVDFFYIILFVGLMSRIEQNSKTATDYSTYFIGAIFKMLFNLVFWPLVVIYQAASLFLG